MYPSSFEETNIDYQMIDGICYINGENLVSHLKDAVAGGVQQILDAVAANTIDNLTYLVAESAITGMAGVGMWVEDCVIQATQEKFREALDKEWPSL